MVNLNTGTPFRPKDSHTPLVKQTNIKEDQKPKRGIDTTELLRQTVKNNLSKLQLSDSYGPDDSLSTGSESDLQSELSIENQSVDRKKVTEKQTKLINTIIHLKKHFDENGKIINTVSFHQFLQNPEITVESIIKGEKLLQKLYKIDQKKEGEKAFKIDPTLTMEELADSTLELEKVALINIYNKIRVPHLINPTDKEKDFIQNQFKKMHSYTQFTTTDITDLNDELKESEYFGKDLAETHIKYLQACLNIP